MNVGLTIDSSRGCHPCKHKAADDQRVTDESVVEERCNFRLNRLRQQRSRAVAPNLSQRIGKSFWLGKLENASLGRGVSLLRWGGGGVEYSRDVPPYPFMSSPTLPAAPKGTIKLQARAFLHWRKQMKTRDG